MDEDTGTVFRDVIMLALLGFVALVVILLPHINLPTEGQQDPAGNLIINIDWGQGLNADVDLWVRAPGQRPVGYSNKNGRIFNLVRDDRGSLYDITSQNYEFVFSRGIIPGEYTINLHMYLNRQLDEFPITVSTTVTLIKEGKIVLSLSSNDTLHNNGQEITVFRFQLTRDGELIPGTVHNIYQPLRSGTDATPLWNR